MVPFACHAGLCAAISSLQSARRCAAVEKGIGSTETCRSRVAFKGKLVREPASLPNSPKYSGCKGFGAHCGLRARTATIPAQLGRRHAASCTGSLNKQSLNRTPGGTTKEGIADT